ncbi:MAG TPA: NAD-dependent epimerase/dehydratase family protein [Bacteroidales bacterium]
MELKVIITGVTGMVGEGVLFECLEHPDIKQVLMVNRRPYELKHPKLKECIIPNFLHLDEFTDQLTGYDACFYCAGKSSIRMNEADYSLVTYDTTLHFAEKLLGLNPNMIFNYVSGSLTDSTEKGKLMWARVKGRTENALMRLQFKSVYNFRPGFMKPTPGQKNIKAYYKIIGGLYPVWRVLFPGQISTMREVGLAMINSVRKGYSKQILEIRDIKALAKVS